MDALYWLYLQHNGKSIAGSYFCYLCRASCTDQHDIQHSIADTFNSHYLAQVPSSHYLCDACRWYLDNKIAHPDFRKMSLIVSSHSWRNWQRETMKQDIRQWLEDGLPEESYLVVSLSKKKHILLQAILNGARSKILAIQIEEQVAYADIGSWSGIEIPFMRLMALGHNKGEILSGNLYGNTLRKHGQLESAMYYNGQLSKWRNGPLIELYSYTTIIEEKDGRAEDLSGDSTGGLQPRIGNTTDSRVPATGRVERNRQRVPEQVPHGNMEDVRGESGSSGPDHQQLDLFSE